MSTFDAVDSEATVVVSVVMETLKGVEPPPTVNVTTLGLTVHVAYVGAFEQLNVNCPLNPALAVADNE